MSDDDRTTWGSQSLVKKLQNLERLTVEQENEINSAKEHTHTVADIKTSFRVAKWLAAIITVVAAVAGALKMFGVL